MLRKLNWTLKWLVYTGNAAPQQSYKNVNLNLQKRIPLRFLKKALLLHHRHYNSQQQYCVQTSRLIYCSITGTKCIRGDSQRWSQSHEAFNTLIMQWVNLFCILIAPRVIIAVPLDESGGMLSFFFFFSLSCIQPYVVRSSALGCLEEFQMSDMPTSSGKIQNEILSLGTPGKSEAGLVCSRCSAVQLNPR